MDSLLELHKAALDVAVSQRFQGRHRSIEDAFTDLKTKHSKIDFEDVDYRRAFECVGQMLETAVPCIQSQPVTDRPRDPTDGMPDLDDLIPRLRSSVAGYDDYITAAVYD